MTGLIVAAICGYSAGCTTYVPKTGNNDTQVSDLISKVSLLEQTISRQESEISSLESEKSSLKMDLSEAELEAQYWKKQRATLQSKISNERELLNDLLGITVLQYYIWTYERDTFQWTLPIPLSVYAEYLDKDRPEGAYNYIDMAKYTADDRYIYPMKQQIDEAASEMKLTMVQKVNFLAAFVQSLPYTADNVTTPPDYYPLYPLETLFKSGGDCEDTTILVAALLDRMDYDVALLNLGITNHMALGVYLPGYHGSHYKHEGKNYYYLETTGEGWEVGQIPPNITHTTASIYPLQNQSSSSLGVSPIQTDVTVGLGEVFTIGVGQSAWIAGEDMTVIFNEVISDSRCPQNVTCIWEGVASSDVTIMYRGENYSVVLSQPGLTEQAEDNFIDYILTYSLNPYPREGEEISPNDYRLTLTLTK